MNIRHTLRIFVLLPFCLWAGAGAQAEQKSAASTVVLITNDIQVAADSSNTQTMHFEMRADNDAGALQIGQTSIPFDSTEQDVEVVEAHTLKPDGKILEVDRSAIYEQAAPGQTAQLVTGLRMKVIVFPQFAAGDTAVYTIKKIVKHPNFANQFIYVDLFPKTIGFNEVRETITAPKSLPLYVESHDVKFSQRDDGNNIIYSWHYSAPKPIMDETVTLSPLDHLPRFFVSSFKDYAQMGQAYAALAKSERTVTPKIKALADDITVGVGDPRTQAQKLYEWVSVHVRYVAIELGSGSFVPHNADLIVDNGYGDCKDHDILLQALLKAKGIDAESILINGSAAYTLTGVPTFTSLDHVITYIPQFDLYLDSTAWLAPFGILPLQEYGKPMVVASATSAGLGRMPILPPGIAKVAIKTVSTLDKDGELTGTTTTTASGPYAISLRFLGLAIQAGGPSAANRMLTASGYENASGSFTQDTKIGFTNDYSISTIFKEPGWADNLSGKNSFYMPPGLRLFSQTGDNVMGPFNPGKLAPGEPTVCFSAEQSEDFSLTAPSGYRFDKVPDDTRVETPNLLFVAHWALTGSTLSVHRTFTAKIDQPLCTGAVRSQSAAALKQISDSYDVNLSFTKTDQTADDAASRDVSNFYGSGISHFSAREYQLAILDFSKVIALKPGYYQGYVGRANAYASLGRNDLAMADYDKALTLKPDDIYSYFGRGSAYFDRQKYDSAIADFDRVLTLNPHFGQLWLTYYRRGMAYWKSNRYAPAIADFDKVIAMKPDVAAAFLYRGDAKIKIGQKKDGNRDIAIALKLNPALGK